MYNLLHYPEPIYEDNAKFQGQLQTAYLDVVQVPTTTDIADYLDVAKVSTTTDIADYLDVAKVSTTAVNSNLYNLLHYPEPIYEDNAKFQGQLQTAYLDVVQVPTTTDIADYLDVAKVSTTTDIADYLDVAKVSTTAVNSNLYNLLHYPEPIYEDNAKFQGQLQTAYLDVVQVPTTTDIAAYLDVVQVPTTTDIAAYLDVAKVSTTAVNSNLYNVLHYPEPTYVDIA